MDLSGLAPGAYCTMILGDLGAEVIKVEPTVPSPLAKGGPSPKGEEKEEDYISCDVAHVMPESEDKKWRKFPPA